MPALPERRMMAQPTTFLRIVLKKGGVGLVIGAGLFGAGIALDFPPVFRWMFFGYALLGTAVFVLLDAPAMKPLHGIRAVVALLAFYVVLSALYVAGASLWPQYNPEVEKGKIEKLLKPRRERAAHNRNEVDRLLQQADFLDVKVRVLTARLNKVAPASATEAPAADGARPAATMTLVEQGREVYDLYECYNCHKVGGKGSVKKRGPVLDNIGSLLTVGDLKKKIFDPGYLYAKGFEKEHKKGRMPDKYRDIMSDEELGALAAYLSTLKNPAVETPQPVFVKTTVEHGFTVYGHVHDLTGKPSAGVEVRATPMKKHAHPGKATSNKEGYYEIFLHLHNEDTGTKITVTAGGPEKEIVATYDPSDKVTKRQAAVDLSAGS